MSSDVRYFINKDRGIIVCKISGCWNIAIKRIDKLAPHFDFYSRNREFDIDDEYVGMAKCAPEDEWDEEYGKKLALNRAKRKRGIAINSKICDACNMMRREMDQLSSLGLHDIPDYYEV